MKIINVLSWGGGTQSTALMLLMLEGKVIEDGVVIKPDYIMFADTKNEAQFVYKQLFKVIDFVKKTYNFDIIITSKNKEQIPDEEAIKLIQKGGNYRTSKYSDLFQEHILFFQGYMKTANVMPFYMVDKNGKVGKTPQKVCTDRYKIQQIMKELRMREKIKSFDSRKHHINMFIGYSVDELLRAKDNPLSYSSNIFPLINKNMTKQDCIEYVETRLGFKPQSSVCNMCYANSFNRIYKIYKEDEEGWQKLLKLDNVMANKPITHQLKNDVYMFQWQAKIGKRLIEIDLDKMKQERDYYKQFTIFDVLEEEEQTACMGGCFL